MMEWFILSIAWLAGLLGSIIIFKLSAFVGRSKIPKKTLILTSIVLASVETVSNLILYSVIDNPVIYRLVNDFLTILFLFVALSYLLRLDWPRLIGLSGIVSLIFAVGTYIVVGIFNVFTGNTSYIESIPVKVALLMGPLLVNWLLYRLLIKVKLDALFLTIYNNRRTRLIATMLFSGQLLMELLIECINPDTLLGQGTIMYAVYWGVFGLLMVWLAHSRHIQMKLAYQEMLLLQQQNYLQSMESIQQDMRVLQHDYKNMLSGLYLQAEEGKNAEIQDYLSKIIGQVDGKVATKIKQTTHLSQVEITELKSLLFTKIMELDKKISQWS